MRKPLAPGAIHGFSRFGRSTSGQQAFTPANSNTRISAPGAMQRPVAAALAAAKAPQAPSTMVNLGLNSDRSRGMMVERLRKQGIVDDRVLAAMLAVPRHLFVDQGLASRAYEDAALPIGFGQTISQPWVVARMISAVLHERSPARVLEVGAGCGYQAAVLAHVTREVFAVERIRGLYDMAREHLKALKLNNRVRLSFGDGTLGVSSAAPFDAIVVAAAGLEIPRGLLEQLAIGARLIAPEGGVSQRLVLIERTGKASWRREELEQVRFVPLRSGIQA
ncbi:protein-L-isoaspartate(D-aspartate) O-methyltransferase [Paracandidimonas soli]|uniref:Protein-L-isoaspartate O-methyltransferase n=1 Tax=Paracandidimonas soli TaxID=1917182 RepID=A0A4R3VFI6_9BURK|nr:protein-L-isoaspartate(D-aspartate) O-methyltransferase [Paracandidimonas soli]TCV01575.1 protein-L-isoaspartate(D-aspartate) O-methyltransferase [Paracandidimonas soli]